MNKDMEESSIKDRIINAVDTMHSGISFVELERQIPGFAGDYEMVVGNNIVVWSGMSEAAIDALFDLRDEGKLHLWPASLLVYICDGMSLTYPIAKAAGLKRGYKTPHWLPSVINSGLPPAKYRRKRG